MKVAAHTMGTPELSLMEAIELFSACRFDGIEIIWDDDYHCALTKNASQSERSELKRLVRDRNLETVCLTPYMTEIASPDTTPRQTHLDDFCRCIDVAAELSAPFIRVYGGAYNPNEEAEMRSTKEAILIESLQILGDRAAQAGVVLAVETHFSTLTCHAAETSRIVRQVNHPHVKVLYDQPNIEFSDGEAYEEALSVLKELVVLVHVKDLVYKQGITGGFTSSKVMTVDESERRISSRIPGEGIMPWPEILQKLKEQGFAGFLSLEYERRWYPHDLPPAADGMKRGLDYVRALLEKMS